nr:immunoglobulin light chain junction region [Macaca mulatta]
CSACDSSLSTFF